MARSCCVLARNVEERLVSSGRVRAFFRKSCVTWSSCDGSPAPVSWIQNSKPPVVPMPGIGGGATGMTIASSMPCASRKRFISTARAFCAFAASVEP